MKCTLTLLSVLALAVPAGAAISTNNASADTFVRAAAPTLNYGGAGALSVSGPNAVNGSGVTNGAFDSFLRFNAGAMVAYFDSLFGANHWAVSGVRLRVTEVGAPNNALFNRGTGAFEIRWIAEDGWTEGTGNPNVPTTTGLTYNDASSVLNGGTDVSLGTFTNAGADVTLSFPLALPAGFISDLKAGGEVGLFLTAVDSGIGFTVDSRSFGTATARPNLEVSALPVPAITSIILSGADVVLAATNGVAGGTYYAMSSTNVELPLNQWWLVATNVPAASGEFSITVTNAANANAPAQQFFIIQTH